MASSMPHQLPWFMQPGNGPPPGYIAGAGRGAFGFTTRSDIGPALEQSFDDVRAAAFAASTAAARGDFAAASAAASSITGAPPMTTMGAVGTSAGGGSGGDDDDDDGRFANAEDEAGLLAGGEYDDDDREADRIYQLVDAKRDEKRKRRREAMEEAQLEKYRRERPKIQQQFSELTQALSSVTEEEWHNLPDVVDLRNKKRKKDNVKELFTPTPDHILLSNERNLSLATSIDPAAGGMTTPAYPLIAPTPVSSSSGSSYTASGTVSTITNFAEIGVAKGKMLGATLDQRRPRDSATGQTVIDPKGYLTDLNSVHVKSDQEIGDAKKARTLLKSVYSTNPHHPPGWIAAARLEEVDGKLGAARQLLARACEECPKSEEVWLEALRLAKPESLKALFAAAAKQIPRSVKLWLKACEASHPDKMEQRRILRRALELIPHSATLWKEAISLETEEADARVMLEHAVECVPESVEMWLALARLQPYSQATQTINKARKLNKDSPDVYLAAAQLEETNGNTSQTNKIIDIAFRTLTKLGAIMERERWIDLAEECERCNPPHPRTCHAIVSCLFKEDCAKQTPPDELQDMWLEDAEACIKKGAVETARAIYASALETFPENSGLWFEAALLERNHGTADALEAVLKRAVTNCPEEEALWLMAAKSKWQLGQLDSAREILKAAFDANPGSEKIWLAAVKLETENKMFANASKVLADAREKASSEKVWMKSVTLERTMACMSDDSAERAFHRGNACQLLQKALSKYPRFDKLWMIQGQLEEEMYDEWMSLGHPKGHSGEGALNRARLAYETGMTNCPQSIPLYILAARLEEKALVVIKARTILENGRTKNPQAADLWLAAVRLERRANTGNNHAIATTNNSSSMANQLLVKALQKVPASDGAGIGKLWAEAIAMEPKQTRRSKVVDAMKNAPNNAIVMASCARLFWSDRKIDKARTWYSKAVALKEDEGDIWAAWFQFETEHGTEAQQQQVVERCLAAEPRYGENWQRIAKDVRHQGLSIREKLVMVAREMAPTLVAG